ncbi:uncharacterized protein LOC107486538 [Arachis duranensis]|uniref:RNA-directed DNA polymerase n=1 Tax=Arachis duranensis TaxID=130453 RepID=A0A6P4D5C2_ARADU|nr:uncharacterized protein LOC107486538 [Arachis duranensis]
MGATPFYHSIFEVRLPKHFDKPIDMRKYLDRFNDKCLEIDGLTDSVASLCLTNGLRNEDFKKHLTTKPVWTMQEIQNVAREFINDEEVSQVVATNKWQSVYNQPRQPGSGERPKEHSKDGAPAKAFKPFPRVGNFTNYTLLRAPIVEVYQQIANKGILSKPRQLKDRTGGNKNIYCDYHKGYGHTTQDFLDLKDALEQAIREGKLAEFSHLLREARRRDRDRTGDDKSHAVRQRQEPEEDGERGLAIVNIVVGRDVPPRSKSASRKDAKVLAVSSSSSMFPSKRIPPISFGPEDQWFDELPEKPPMVITARVGTGLVKRILVDTGVDSNIMFRNTFDALVLRDTDLKTHQHGVVSLGDNFIKPDGIISLLISVGGRGKRSVIAEFVVLRNSTAYNLILGRRTINELRAVISTKLLVMKFVADDGSIGSIRGDLETAVACDNASLSLRRKSKEASGVFLADLDARVDDKPRPEPEGDLEKFRVGDSKEKFTFVNRNLPQGLKGPLVEMIRANGDLFAWTPADMSGIDPQFMSHHLAVRAEAKPVAQRRRKMSQERAEEVARKMASLLEVGFIRELDYATWLSNIVLVKKANGRWRMCVGYSDLNKTCPKDSFPLPNIDALVDAATRYRYLCFMDAYSGYNQIPMHRPDEEKTSFITPGGTYCYKVMPFGLKDAGATYQRLMNKIFNGLIGKTVEVYVNDILVKTTRAEDLIGDLENVFTSLRRHDMRLNPLKCAFAGGREIFGVYDNPKRSGGQPGEVQSNLTNEEPKMRKRRAETGRKANRAISIPRSVSCQGPTLFQLDEKRDSVRIDPSLQGSLPSLQKHHLLTTCPRRPGAGRRKVQQPVYLVSKALQGAELRYSKLEKLAYALLTSSRRLRQYFQGYQIIVRTDQYKPRHAIKAQAMADFLVEVTGSLPEQLSTRWKLHVDGASNQTFGGAWTILESPTGVIYEQSVKFEFSVSNNQAEYEALLGGLLLAKEINGTYQAIDSLLQKYLEKVKKLSQEFDEVTVQHVPRERNTRTDLLSKLASTKPGTGNRSLMQGLEKEPTVALHITQATDSPSWMDPIKDYLERGSLPSDDKTAKALRREVAKYTIIQGQLFKKGLNQPLLKYLHPGQTDYVLSEVHEGCCSHHIGGKALAQKIVKAGYYWPSIMADSKEFVKRCKKCQENDNFHKASTAKLSLLMSSRPFSQ